MKKLLLSFLIAVLIQTTYAQYGIKSISYSPSAPTASDTVYFYVDVVHASCANAGCGLKTSTINKSLTQITDTTVLCFRACFGEPTTCRDTIAIAPLSAGNYSFRYHVLMSVYPGCSPTNQFDADSISFSVSESNSVFDFEKQNGTLVVAPVPAPNSITVSGYRLSGKGATVDMYNIFGEKVFQSEIRDHQTEIDISSFATGIYLVQVNEGEEIFRNKL